MRSAPLQRSRNRSGTSPALTPAHRFHSLEHMQHPVPVERDFTAFSVRDGRLAPITCVACGCRLEQRADGTWWHFGGRGERDARGCIVACAERPHYGGIAAVIG